MIYLVQLAELLAYYINVLSREAGIIPKAWESDPFI